MKKSIFDSFSENAKIKPTPGLKPRMSHPSYLKQSSIGSTSQSQKSLLTDLLNQWMLFDSTNNADASEKVTIKHFRNKLENHRNFSKLLDYNKRTGEHLLFDFINECQIHNKHQDLQEILTLYIDSITESSSAVLQ